MLSDLTFIRDLFAMHWRSPALVAAVVLLLGALFTWPARRKKGVLWFISLGMALLGVLLLPELGVQAHRLAKKIGWVQSTNSETSARQAAARLDARGENGPLEAQIEELTSLPLAEFDRRLASIRERQEALPREHSIAAERLFKAQVAALRRDSASARTDYAQCSEEFYSLERAGNIRQRDIVAQSVRCRAAKEVVNPANR